MSADETYSVDQYVAALADPSDKGHALRWLRGQSQSDKRDFIITLAASDLHAALEAVQRVELHGDYLIASIKPCLDADISTLRHWFSPILHILGADRYLSLIDELIDEHPARACRAMWWLEPKLHGMGLLHYHKHAVAELRVKFGEVDRPDDILDWAFGRGDSTGDPPVT